MISAQRLAKCVEFGDVLYGIDKFNPIRRSRNWPLLERNVVAVFAERVQTRPAPILGSGDQTLPQCVSLDIPAHAPYGHILLHRNSLESSLIHGAPTARAVSSIPPIRMRALEPMHAPRKFFNAFANNNKVPVIRHQAVRDYFHFEPKECFANDSDERGVIRISLEKDRAPDRPIHHVKDGPLKAAPQTSRHKIDSAMQTVHRKADARGEWSRPHA